MGSIVSGGRPCMSAAVPSWKRAFVTEASPHAAPGVLLAAAAELCRKLEQAPFTLKACGGIETSTNEFGLSIVEDMLRHNRDLSAVPQNPLVHPTWKLDVALQLPLKALKNRWLRRPLVLVGLRATGDCRLADWSASSDAPSLLLARGDYDADGATATTLMVRGLQALSVQKGAGQKFDREHWRRELGRRSTDVERSEPQCGTSLNS